MSAALTEVSSNCCFGGIQKVFSHESHETKTKMTFAVYIPPQAETKKVPVLYWLSGLTCTEQNFITKAGAQRYAAEYGLMIVCPDTSPRGLNIEGEHDSYDFGSGAGFYVDATESKWKTNYRMYSYVTKELPALVEKEFNAIPERKSISGHSMGGHGALVLALKNPGMYSSVSAFSPICNPTQCDWGRKAFKGYLGEDTGTWKAYDAAELVKKYNGPPLSILADQGTADEFLTKGQLLPDQLVSACASNQVAIQLRMQDGYDHSYYFISSFIGDHIRHHAAALNEPFQ